MVFPRMPSDSRAVFAYFIVAFQHHMMAYVSAYLKSMQTTDDIVSLKGEVPISSFRLQPLLLVTQFLKTSAMG